MDAQEVTVGWWPGDPRHGKAALYAYVHPPPEEVAGGELSPPGARWDAALGEYVLDWDEVCSSSNPHRTALDFARAAFRHACVVSNWDPELAASADRSPPPIR
jgi:Family of unknown function (DUF5996)